MLWLKDKYTVGINNGIGEISTRELHGLIHQLLIIPSINCYWNCKVLDSDLDVIYEIKNHKNELNKIIHLPVGQSKPEILKIRFYNAFKKKWLLKDIKNKIEFNVILKIMESKYG